LYEVLDPPITIRVCRQSEFIDGLCPADATITCLQDCEAILNCTAVSAFFFPTGISENNGPFSLCYDRNGDIPGAALFVIPYNVTALGFPGGPASIDSYRLKSSSSILQFDASLLVNGSPDFQKYLQTALAYV
jgi:hypothetical protein